jgi:hypothetical protein
LSLDVEVYSNRASSLAELRTVLPSHESWQDYGGELAFEGEEWQVLVGEPEAIETMDVPPDLAALMGDAQYRIPLTLEPIGAPEEGQRFLESVLQSVGSVTGGVSYDLRTGEPRRIGQ